MSSSFWFYPYPELHPGILLKRYKRFFADIKLDSGDTITAHCPNTGSMTGVCQIGSRVLVSQSDNPKRKLAYTWEAIEVNDIRPAWVGVNTALPNRAIRAALAARILPQLEPYTEIKAEVPYGRDRKSRIDFLLTGEASPVYIEVKNTTWAQGSQALFPDTVTTRGQKHLRELTALAPQARAVMLYFINRGDCPEFSPGDTADPAYGLLLRTAIAAGVEVLPCRFEVTRQGLTYLGLATLKLKQ
ncbi:MAG: DNA/RNA nuclease SfsA [Leptolyngbyaceae cyanobacterium SM1_1_3]|nr:DNA/RNA nuclease SfsA [Leptolyngbyaceae cyanobacterium SM1_1_3]NJN04548.1 DNA/RNA nuclease SfsA [Leptolyngbyaceae cyanobacterium RM1_1_2]NJO10961.1 DNA/RNA nuclease SfsA [Leptolyngbyaceae cyanobacterium SL_1_1]